LSAIIRITSYCAIVKIVVLHDAIHFRIEFLYFPLTKEQNPVSSKNATNYFEKEQKGQMVWLLKKN